MLRAKSHCRGTVNHRQLDSEVEDWGFTWHYSNIKDNFCIDIDISDFVKNNYLYGRFIKIASMIWNHFRIFPYISLYNVSIVYFSITSLINLIYHTATFQFDHTFIR